MRGRVWRVQSGAGRSPAAVSRHFLEAHVGTELLHRTTRALKLSEPGERYVAACLRVLVDLGECEVICRIIRDPPACQNVRKRFLVDWSARSIDEKGGLLHQSEAVS